MLDPVAGEAPTPVEATAKGYALVGTLDTVIRSLEALRAELPVDWIFWRTHYGSIPHAELMRSMELFRTEALPRFS